MTPIRTQGFSLKEQIQHKVAFLKKECLGHRSPPTVLLGHSIGAYMALHAVKAIETEADEVYGKLDAAEAEASQQLDSQGSSKSDDKEILSKDDAATLPTTDRSFGCHKGGSQQSIQIGIVKARLVIAPGGRCRCRALVYLDEGASEAALLWRNSLSGYAFIVVL